MNKFERTLKSFCLVAMLAGAVMAMAAGTPKVAEKAKARHYLIGLQMYTVRDECAKDFPGTLAAVGKIGFSGVEFAGYYGRSAPEIRKMLDDDHLKCYGSHISIDDLLGDNFQKTVDFAKILGNHLLVIPGLPDQYRSSKAAWIQTAKLFSDLAAKLKPYGIMLGYHNHMLEFQPVDGELPWDIFFANSSPDVKIQFDIGNALEGGAQALPFLTKYPGRVVSVHVKDYSASDNAHTLLGQGDEHWNDVIPVLKARNGPRWFIIEQETYPYPSLECAAKCKATLEKMLGE